MGATGEGNLPTSRRRQCSTSPSEPEQGNIGKARRWYTQAIDFGHPDSARQSPEGAQGTQGTRPAGGRASARTGRHSPWPLTDQATLSSHEFFHIIVAMPHPPRLESRGTKSPAGGSGLSTLLGWSSSTAQTTHLRSCGSCLSFCLIRQRPPSCGNVAVRSVEHEADTDDRSRTVVRRTRKRVTG